MTEQKDNARASRAAGTETGAGSRPLTRLIEQLDRTRFFGCCTNGCQTDKPKCERCVFIAELKAALESLAQFEQPVYSTTEGRLLLNAYGRQCYEAGQKSVHSAVELFKPAPRDAAEDLPDPDYGF